MTSFTDEQVRLEAEMAELGVHRYRAKLSKAMKRGKESETQVGRYLLREAVDKAETAIVAWTKGAKRAAGRHHAALPLVRLFKPAVLALITARHALDAASGLREGRPFGTFAIALGQRLEDEHRFNVFRAQEGMVWGSLMKEHRRAGYSHLRGAIVHRAGQLGIRDRAWPVRDKARLGTLLLELLIKATGLVEVRTLTHGKRTESVLVMPDAVLDWIARSHEAHEVLAPFNLPTVSRPVDWSDVHTGGYHTDLVKRWPLVNAHTRSGLETLEKAHMPAVLRSVNLAQGSLWKVNTTVLDVVEHLWDSGTEAAGLPARDRDVLPAKPADIEHNEEARLEWRREAAKCYSKSVSQRTQRIQVERTLFVARKFRDRAFHFPQYLDWRGRMYPIPYFLTPQGNDLARGLLTFARPGPVDREALDCLVVHGANVWGLDKLTMDERRTWVALNEPHIRSVHRDPLDDTWWTGAECPFQFLAFCLAYVVALDDGRCSLPCYVDGTNNGLQVFSLLLRDRAGAVSTNVVGSNRVMDVYADTAHSAASAMASVGTPGSIQAAWFTFLRDHCAGELPRAAVKRSVMTLPYGATQYSCQRYVLDWYEGLNVADEDRPWRRGKPTYDAVRVLSTAVWDAIHRTVPGAVGCMEWLRECSSVFTKHQLPVKWVSPSGFPITQMYHKYHTRQVRTAIGQTVKWVRYRQSKDRIDGHKQANAISPNYVHSLDSACLALVLNRLEAEGVRDVSTIHDSFAVHPHLVRSLQRVIREVYRDVFRPNLLADLQRQFQAQVPVPLPDHPVLGDLDVNELIESTYFFS